MFQLPREIQNKIWSFDSTYKRENDKVLHEVKYRYCMMELTRYSQWPPVEWFWKEHEEKGETKSGGILDNIFQAKDNGEYWCERENYENEVWKLENWDN